MAEEKGRHLSFFKIKQNTLLTFLLPSVFAAVWYFPRLSVYFFWQKPAAPDPCTITPVSSSRQSYHCYYFLTSRLLCSLYKRGQLSKQQRDNRDCSFTFLLSEATKGQTRDGGRERMDVCRQILHTRDGHFFQICFLSACVPLTRLQTDTQHPQRLRWAPRAKRWSWNPAAAEENPLGPVRWAQKTRSPHIAVCSCLKKLHYQP